MRTLSLVSIATGIGFAWPKFIAFATDWDEAISLIGPPFSHNGIQATGSDIWNGGTVNAVVPRAHVDTVEKLLGKRVGLLDIHSLAAADTVAKMRTLRFRASSSQGEF